MKINKNLVPCLFFLLTFFSSDLLLAKGSELKFNSLVISVSQTGSNEGTLTVSVRDVEIPISINGDTEIQGSGEEIDLEDISAGDFVKVNAFFSDTGLVANEIAVLDERSPQFRFRGFITATDTVGDSTVITVMGVDITLDSSTSITRRGSGGGNSVPAVDLLVGDDVNIRGGLTDGLLHAARIHVGTREQGIIELEGVISDISEAGFTINIEGGGATTIVIDDSTSVSGDIIAGAFVEIEGQLTPELSVLAFEVVIDVDGDGDADDDNHRGKRGDENSGKGNNGKGKGNNKNNDSDEGGEDDNTDGSEEVDENENQSTAIDVGSEITLTSDSTNLTGRAATSYKADNEEVVQTVEVAIEHAEAGAAFTLVVYFGEESAEFGSITANELGSAVINFLTGDDTPDYDLSGLLPDELDVRDITAVELLSAGSVVLAGNF